MIDFDALTWTAMAEWNDAPKQARMFFDNGRSFSIVTGFPLIEPGTYEVALLGTNGKIWKYNGAQMIFYLTPEQIRELAVVVSAWQSEDDAQRWAEEETNDSE